MSLILNGDTGVSKVQDGVLTQADIANAINVTGDAPIFGCRAWVNFDGTRNVTDTGASTNGQPVKIRASGNVTSVTKNATGSYTVNFTTAMPDANYSASTIIKYLDGSGSSGVARISNSVTALLSTSISLIVCNGANFDNVFDAQLVTVSIFR